jgi:hypothetical protein
MEGEVSSVSSEGLKRAKKTADRYITRSGGTPPSEPRDQNTEGLELTQHKWKIRRQREEINKLKKSILALRFKLKDYVA